MLQDSDCNHKYCQTQPWNSGEWNIIACYIKGPCKNMTSHLWWPNIFEYSRNHLLSLIIEQTLSILGQNVQDIMERQTMSKCANFTNILFHGESSADLSHQKALLALATTYETHRNTLWEVTLSVPPRLLIILQSLYKKWLILPSYTYHVSTYILLLSILGTCVQWSSPLFTTYHISSRTLIATVAVEVGPTH